MKTLILILCFGSLQAQVFEKHDLVSLPVSFLSGAMYGYTQVYAFHYDNFKQVHPNANDQWFNQDLSSNNKYTKQYEKELAKAQKHLSRKTKGSNSFERQRWKIAKLHEKITNSRMDNLHKVSHQLVSDYDIIALEDLNVKGMVKNHKLAKHISDASWGTFVRLLEYKADWNDKQIVKINRFYPSSKTCCECGWINQDLNLSIREWSCKNGHVLDRDLNAAKNILKEGLKIISSGTGDYTGGDLNKTLATKHKSVKPEAHLSLANG